MHIYKWISSRKFRFLSNGFGFLNKPVPFFGYLFQFQQSISLLCKQKWSEELWILDQEYGQLYRYTERGGWGLGWRQNEEELKSPPNCRYHTSFSRSHNTCKIQVPGIYAPKPVRRTDSHRPVRAPSGVWIPNRYCINENDFVNKWMHTNFFVLFMTMFTRKRSSFSPNTNE